MFMLKNVNQINGNNRYCSPLCRDPRRLNFFNNLSVEARSVLRSKTKRRKTAGRGRRHRV